VESDGTLAQIEKASAMKFAIGVITFNDGNVARLLPSAIQSASQARKYHQFSAVLIGVDNGEPRFSTFIQEWSAGEGVETLSLPSLGNVGFAKAMNRMMEEGFKRSCDYFLAVNPDGVFHANCLNELVNAAQRSPNAVLEARQFPEEHSKFYDPISGETAWVSGACLAIPKRVYDRIGGFDDNIFIYNEDVDLSWRAQAEGFETRIAFDALFAHEIFGRKWSQRAKKNFFGSRIYLASKWGASEFVQKYKQDYLQRFGDAAEALARIDEYIALGAQAHEKLSDQCKKMKPPFDALGHFSPFRWTG
jgi:GT2 family glycosyltransferase